MTTHILSFCLGILGSTGAFILLLLAGVVFWRYQGSPQGSFRWHVRNLHLKHIAALASMFFLAMAASYAILLEAWALLYFIVAFKTGTWWLRLAFTQRA